LGLNVSCLIGPQQGYRGEKQDNMVESDDFRDPATGLKVFSLYGKTREPDDNLLSSLDTFLIDLQDVGTRIYTFIYTMANCMRAAKRGGEKVVVLDRPNPIDGIHVEGNVLEPGFTSFVGQYPICVRHGMTIGELALLFNEEFGIGCDLEVIPLKGWKRRQFADEWKRDWIPTTFNVPTVLSLLTFPGTVHFEGTAVSEGRGTTRPFEWIGAPYVDPDRLAAEMNGLKQKGVYFRAMYFQPTFHKGKDEVCGGVQIHVTDRKLFNSYQAGIYLLWNIARLYPKQFAWKPPPYEYEHDRMPIDLIAGTDRLRRDIESGKGLKDFDAKTKQELAAFKRIRATYLLYKA
jgi:uncharacterized protein YbbC (DUF1343 family)